MCYISVKFDDNNSSCHQISFHVSVINLYIYIYIYIYVYIYIVLFIYFFFLVYFIFPNRSEINHLKQSFADKTSPNKKENCVWIYKKNYNDLIMCISLRNISGITSIFIRRSNLGKKKTLPLAVHKKENISVLSLKHLLFSFDSILFLKLQVKVFDQN